MKVAAAIFIVYASILFPCLIKAETLVKCTVNHDLFAAVTPEDFDSAIEEAVYRNYPALSKMYREKKLIRLASGDIVLMATNKYKIRSRIVKIYVKDPPKGPWYTGYHNLYCR